MRLRLDLSYDGARFHGWAAQPDTRTVQGEVEAAVATILSLETPVPLTCAGRTDAGVHARGQVAHVDLDDSVDVEALARRLRSLLPDDIGLRSLAPAPPGFDARFSALERRYVYRMRDRGPSDPLARGHVVDWPRELDVDAMNAAAEHLLGEHDFAAFCKKREGATTIRTLLAFRCERQNGLLEATVRADAFCHSMVRSLMGTLVAVGEHRFAPDWAASVLASAVRDARIRVMPAHGLVLEEVVYPPDDALAARASQARRRRGH
ncbi:MAG: tRNA pseudouridine(38-40) synthase TruA [Aeromicrobium sp.]